MGKGMAAGADLYITKPFSNRELMDRIRQLLAS
jgi:DNA-binding response OmpR family regulator